ncbi:hypothetical protein [Marinicella sp. W31]|uniref:hypothetical protein n=1 Tax=Marinicella sp. W31 TaxID=3023713 RepID=UPI00375811FA
MGNYLGTNKQGTGINRNNNSDIRISAGEQHYIGALTDGISIHGNLLAGSDNTSISVSATNIFIYGNTIGTDLSNNINLGPNAGNGIGITSASNVTIGDSAPNQANVIANFIQGIDMVVITPNPQELRDNNFRSNQVRGNSIFNVDQMINIRDIRNPFIDTENLNSNDPDDADMGMNKLMNYPRILGISYDQQNAPDAVNVDFMIDATANHADYPLTIDVYFTDLDENLQGRYHLGAFSYTTPQAIQTIQLQLPKGIEGGKLALTTTDADSSTSELSPAATFGNLDIIFADGFDLDTE